MESSAAALGVAPVDTGVARRVWGWITTVDHKRIGLLYGATALFFFLVGGLEALLIRIQLARPENHFLGAETYNQLFTMHGTTMIFLAVMPLSASFFNFVVPLQLGARDVAFPRLNAFSYWVFLLGGIFLNLSFVRGGAPDAGWFGYANLTSRQFSPGHGIDFWAVGLQILGIASLAAAFNFIVTILNLRAPGMKLMRMPVFSWMTLVTSFLIALAFPLITVALVLLLFDRLTGTNFYVPASGADPLLWQHLFWLFGHPEVYILILPAMGIVSEVLPTFAKKPLFGYPVVVYSGIFIGFLGFGVWSHHMFAVGLGPMADSFFAISTMLIAIPTGVKIFNWIATLWGGRLELRSAMLFALGFIGMFVIGGLSGVMHASPPADLQQTDTYFVVAHLHYVLFGGSIMAIFAGIYYWFPKLTGRRLDERLGKVHFWLNLLAMNVTFFPMHFAGLLGMPRRVYTYSADLHVGGLNLASTIGALGLGVATLVFAVNLIRSARRGAPAGADPWGGATLEWAIASPPPPHNFGTVPAVGGRDPLWSGRADEIRAQATTLEGPLHMPRNSYWPVVSALGITLLLGGMVFGWWTGIPGLVLTLLGIFSWSFEPAHAGGGAHAAPAEAHAGGTGLPSRKLLFWAFLGSECMFFGSLIATYLVYRGRDTFGPRPHDVFNIPLTSYSALILLMSSLTMVLALAAVQRGARRPAMAWLAATALLGMHFVGNQIYEFTDFVHHGLKLQTNLFSCSFYVLTGFHGTHVTVGVIWLWTLFVRAWRGQLPRERALDVEIAGLYWHFVDVVWVAIFTLVYLIH